jgi:hypothetical protein
MFKGLSNTREYVYATPVEGMPTFWRIGGNVYSEGSIVKPSIVDTSNPWAFGWKDHDRIHGKLKIGRNMCASIQDLYSGISYILRNEQIEVIYTREQWEQLLISKGKKTKKRECTFEYGGEVGTVQDRCPYTGQALRAGLGELTLSDVRRELGK